MPAWNGQTGLEHRLAQQRKNHRLVGGAAMRIEYVVDAHDRADMRTRTRRRPFRHIHPGMTDRAALNVPREKRPNGRPAPPAPVDPPTLGAMPKHLAFR